jgi:hypothetical protein
MAVVLIAEWRLTVLRVELDLAGAVPEVQIELSIRPDGTPRTLGTWHYPLAAFGVTDGREPPRSLTVPDDLTDRVYSALRSAPGTKLGGRMVRGEALWLRLVPPYGYLGAVPWEQALARVHQLMLRVPDRLPAAVDPGNVLTMAIAVCAPAGSTWVRDHVRGLLDGLRHLVTRTPLDVHIFADADTARLLRMGPLADWQHVHDPFDARRAATVRSSAVQAADRGRPRAPGNQGQTWADWVASGLAGRAARAVHVVADAGWDGDRPVLLVTPDPTEKVNESTCTTVTAEQLGRLTDQVGAATLSIASPPSTRSDTATRVIADQLGQTRRGPTLYSSIIHDPNAVELAYAYSGLFSPRFRIPYGRSLFAYLQPEHLRDTNYPVPDDGTSPGDDPPRLPESLASYFSTAASVPLWAAAAQRYVEAGQTALRTAADQPEMPVKRAYDKGSADALAGIQALLARHLGEH